jgi:hypothetical protein
MQENMRKILTILSICLCTFQTSAQTWPKLYGASVHKGGYKINETYDDGYILTGNFIAQGGSAYMGFFMKTDINGEILWEKHIGEIGYRFGIVSSHHTTDGGMIISSFTTKFDSWGDSYIMKLNACMEQEWCNIFHIPGHHHAAWDVLEMPDGNFIALLNYYSYDLVNERIWLLCLSPSGEVLWEKVYAQEHDYLDFNNESGYVLTYTSEGNILITGDCLLVDPEWPASRVITTLHVMVDSTGEELWAEPFRESDEQKFLSHALRTIEYTDGIFYTCGTRSVDPFYKHSVAVLMKFSSNGDYLDHIIVYPSQNHVTATINNAVACDTNHLVLTGSYQHGFEKAHIMLYKTDTLGNILHEKELYRDDNGIKHATLTSDNYVIMTSLHYVLGNPNRWKVYINKVDGELNEAEFDPRQLTYDSLCPYPIVTDTIVPDCDIILGHRPPELTAKGKAQQLEVYPNPAGAYATIKLPESVSRHGHNGFMSHTTVWHHWIKDASLHVFNIHGQQIHTQNIPDGQQQLQLDVSAWPPGVYLLRVKAMNGIMVDGKVMVR